MKVKISDRYIGEIASCTAFLGAFAYFLTAYPYHLMRREQLDLFVYDWQYICETYKGIGLLSRMAGDFIDQFFFFPVIGPAIVALILTAIGSVVYKISRNWLGKWASIGIAFVFFAWSFMRETENLYLTQYSFTTLAYLSLVLATIKLCKNWKTGVCAVLLVAVSIPLLGRPYHKDWGKLWGKPEMLNERIIALDVEASREHWDKVRKLSETDYYTREASYYYNLSQAMDGRLGDRLFFHSQDLLSGVFLWVSDQMSQFTNGMAGELWYQLGDMTLAEQSAIVALQTSPKHTGARYIKRLAQITLISGEDGAAQKYLRMLSKTLKYRKWALSMMPDNQDEAAKEWLKTKRSMLTEADFVYGTSDFRPILKGLLEANPDNGPARQYLLCNDILFCDFDAFVEDYSEKMVPGRHFEEALCIYLILNGQFDEESAKDFGISNETLSRLQRFYKTPELYENTYWYYYMDVTEE